VLWLRIVGKPPGTLLLPNILPQIAGVDNCGANSTGKKRDLGVLNRCGRPILLQSLAGYRYHLVSNNTFGRRADLLD